jgi:uncharacterized protein
MNSIKIGVAIMPEIDFLKASLPLFQNEEIDVIEWSFDTLISENSESEWLSGLLDTYSNENKLLGHGVYYSLFDARWTERQENWLSKLKKETSKRKYNHISEHFGFMSSSDYHAGFPLPVSLNDLTLKIGIDRIKRIQDTVQLPIGIENLAFSFSKTDVEEQGIFIEKIINSVGGFVILDLHNIYCQSHNFGIEIIDLINLYPLNQVKEIHVSGGSWQDSLYSKNKKIRRDTHDENIPNVIFEVLPDVISKCKNLEFVIFERLGNSFKNDDDFVDYQNDFLKLKKIVKSQEFIKNNKIWSKNYSLEKIPFSDLDLYNEQQLLAKTLSETKDCSQIQKMKLQNWNVNSWDFEMINTAIQISQKWSSESH